MTWVLVFVFGTIWIIILATAVNITLEKVWTRVENNKYIEEIDLSPPPPTSGPNDDGIVHFSGRHRS